MSKAISVSTGPIFTIFSPNGRYLCEFSRSCPVFPIPQGTFDGNQFCDKIVAKLPTPCTYRSVIPKRNGYCYLNERISSANDASILCENFVKFGPVVFELKWGRKWKLWCDSAEIHDFRSVGILPFGNRLECHNFDFCCLIGSHFCTSLKIWWDLN